VGIIERASHTRLDRSVIASALLVIREEAQFDDVVVAAPWPLNRQGGAKHEQLCLVSLTRKSAKFPLS